MEVPLYSNYTQQPTSHKGQGLISELQ